MDLDRNVNLNAPVDLDGDRRDQGVVHTPTPWVSAIGFVLTTQT